MKKILISPSLMCADLLNLQKEIKALEEAGADYHHIDVMDGEFVPNIQIGTATMAAVRRAAKLPLDIHLMITAPHMKLGYFDVREGDAVSVHYESTPHPGRVLSEIKERGAKALLALNPATPVSVCEGIASLLDGILIMTVDPGYAGQKLIPDTIKKISEARELLDSAGSPNGIVEVDGNVSYENAIVMKKAGADMLVCGSSSLFDRKYTYAEAIKILKEV